MAAFLGQVGRGQVDHDPAARKGETETGEGAAHAFAAFAHRLVAQAHDDGPRIAGRELDLDLHPARIHALKCDGDHPRDHPGPSCPCKLAAKSPLVKNKERTSRSPRGA